MARLKKFHNLFRQFCNLFCQFCNLFCQFREKFAEILRKVCARVATTNNIQKSETGNFVRGGEKLVIPDRS